MDRRTYLFFSALQSRVRSEVTIQCTTQLEVIPFYTHHLKNEISIKIYIVNQLSRAKTFPEVSEGLVVENVSRCEQVLPM